MKISNLPVVCRDDIITVRIFRRMNEWTILNILLWRRRIHRWNVRRSLYVVLCSWIWWTIRCRWTHRVCCKWEINLSNFSHEECYSDRGGLCSFAEFPIFRKNSNQRKNQYEMFWITWNNLMQTRLNVKILCLIDSFWEILLLRFCLRFVFFSSGTFEKNFR